MELTHTKLLVAGLLGLLRFFFGVLPVKLYKLLRHWEKEEDAFTFINKKRHQQVNCMIALCQSFGGGVLFATCFLHMMLDVWLSVEELKKYGNLNTEYPLSQLIICMGFFFVYFLEEISHWIISNIPAEPCKNKNGGGRRSITPISSGNKVTPSKENFQDDKSAFIVEENTEKFKEAQQERLDTLSVDSNILRENEKNLALEEKPVVEEEKTLIKKERTQQQIMRFVLVVVALSLHAFFEGLAMGIQDKTAEIWYLFIAIIIHSATILFCIGLEMLLAQTKLKTIYILMSILASASPSGVLLGLLITLNSDMNSRAKSTAVILLEGLSTGTIIYITFFEVLNREKERRIYRLRRAVCILVGFTLMAVLQYLEITH